MARHGRQLRRSERARARAAHARRCRHDPLRGDRDGSDRVRRAGRDAFYAEASAGRAADFGIQLPRRRTQPAALHGRGRRQEAESTMSTRTARQLVYIAIVATYSLAATAQQPERAASFVAPRLVDGKTPDFRGIWQARGTAYVNIEGHAGEKGVPRSASIVVDPPDGKIPYKPEALA